MVFPIIRYIKYIYKDITIVRLPQGLFLNTSGCSIPKKITSIEPFSSQNL